MTSSEDTKQALLAAARANYGVPAATTTADVASLLRGWGAEPIDLDRHKEALVDEFVDASLVYSGWTIADAELLKARASDKEREMFVEDPDEDFDPYAYGEDEVEWTTWAQETGILKRLMLLLEHSTEDTNAPGNFRVYGAGQWLRESLWAATGVVPRDTGGPGLKDAPLFARAFAFEGREPLTSLPIGGYPPDPTDEELREFLLAEPEDDDEGEER